MPTAFWPSRQWRDQLALTRRAQAVLANLASPGLARGFRAWADLAAARAAARAATRAARQPRLGRGWPLVIPPLAQAPASTAGPLG